jgi:hypothetical protein
MSVMQYFSSFAALSIGLAGGAVKSSKVTFLLPLFVDWLP